ncbi:uncharacterized protein BO66DRAFT_243671 [Aspergillus aculeatinus CBS 121060]|uniref:Uncharacterized protein n=1 Tax=Aspergillus aculeatinus CBS 121060 TaxID=1448322 RepID=A0ACD1GSW8_9EURO|nr:hypothetical protein BO66DRAFT_243671 [Aspergillus aculeatinus CBS 121060]RAH64357.1 hypothetical protein BO66DRAFT_243671 [Aspergillus aculeatinus CBS 121060]
MALRSGLPITRIEYEASYSTAFSHHHQQQQPSPPPKPQVQPTPPIQKPPPTQKPRPHSHSLPIPEMKVIESQTPDGAAPLHPGPLTGFMRNPGAINPKPSPK